MGTAFGAGSHVSVSGTAVAGINNRVASVDGLRVVVVAGQAVGGVAGTRSVDASQVGELLIYVSRAST